MGHVFSLYLNFLYLKRNFPNSNLERLKRLGACLLSAMLLLKHVLKDFFRDLQTLCKLSGEAIPRVAENAILALAVLYQVGICSRFHLEFKFHPLF